MFEPRYTGHQTREWVPVAAVVILLHALLIGLVLRVRSNDRGQLADAGSGAGVAGLVAGAAPLRTEQPIMCAYFMNNGVMALHHFDRASHGSWARCAPAIDTTGVLGASIARRPGSPATSPTFINLRFDVDSAGHVVTQNILEDGGNAAYAKALEESVARIHHATPPGMGKMSAPVPYTYLLTFRAFAR